LLHAGSVAGEFIGSGRTPEWKERRLGIDPHRCNERERRNDLLALPAGDFAHRGLWIRGPQLEMPTHPRRARCNRHHDLARAHNIIITTDAIRSRSDLTEEEGVIGAW